MLRGDGAVHADRLEGLRRDAGFVSVAESHLDRRVLAAVEALDGDGEFRGDAYVYGFSSFVDAAVAALDAAGVDEEWVHAERFD